MTLKVADRRHMCVKNNTSINSTRRRMSIDQS